MFSLTLDELLDALTKIRDRVGGDAIPHLVAEERGLVEITPDCIGYDDVRGEVYLSSHPLKSMDDWLADLCTLNDK